MKQVPDLMAVTVWYICIVYAHNNLKIVIRVRDNIQVTYFVMKHRENLTKLDTWQLDKIDCVIRNFSRDLTE